MKHITYADKSILTGEDIADLLVDYAALLTNKGMGDSVTIKGFSDRGEDVEANMLLSEGAPILAETVHSSLPEPDNAEAVEYVRRRVMLLSNPPTVVPEDDKMPAAYEDLDLI
ncbi:MAG TPA: hypothetical protein VIL55_08340 [Naasia sp.]|jgi:hypothetical protein